MVGERVFGVGVWTFDHRVRRGRSPRPSRRPVHPCACRSRSLPAPFLREVVARLQAHPVLGIPPVEPLDGERGGGAQPRLSIEQPRGHHPTQAELPGRFCHGPHPIARSLQLGTFQAVSGARLVGHIPDWIPNELFGRITDHWIAGDWANGSQAAGEVSALKLCRRPDDLEARAQVEQSSGLRPPRRNRPLGEAPEQRKAIEVAKCRRETVERIITVAMGASFDVTEFR